MLRTDLPEIITETLPGPKAQAIIDRREAGILFAVRFINLKGYGELVWLSRKPY